MKKILTAMLCFCLLITSVIAFSGCGCQDKNKQNVGSGGGSNENNNTWSKSYTNISALKAAGNDNYASDAVGVQITSDEEAYFFANNKAYFGSFAPKESENEASYTIQFNASSKNYTFDLDVMDDRTELKETTTGEKLIGEEAVVLTEEEESTFDDGLYVGLGSCLNGVYSDSIEAGTFRYKKGSFQVESDSVDCVNQMEIIVVGDALVHIYFGDRSKEDTIVGLFFVNKQGEHTEGFVNEFGDLDYVIAHIEDENEIYYLVKAKNSDITLNVTEDFTLTATKLFKSFYTGHHTEYTNETVNYSLNIKANGTVIFNDGTQTYNGTWVNIGHGDSQGILVMLDDNTFFDGYFALGLYDEAGVQLSNFKTGKTMSTIDTDEDTRYEIGWTAAAQSYIESINVAYA